MRQKGRKTVFVSIPTEERAERLKFEGVLAYAHEKLGEKWNLQTDPGGLLPRVIQGRRMPFDGIIAYVTSARTRALLSQVNCPVVLIEDLNEPSSPLERRNATTLVVDHFEEGRKAAEYFLERHFTHFAWVGPTRRTAWADRRKDGYAATLGAHKHRVHVYPPVTGEARDNFAVEIAQLSKWLANLPRPCAVFVCRDARARQVISAAAEAELPVPESLAVLGVDNDEMIDTTVVPALSSIDTSDRVIGYTSGRILNELMLKRAKGRVIRTHHPHIITRRSTDADAIDDVLVRETLDYARKHLSEDLSAAALAQRANLPAHALQRRAEQALGITLGREIQRIRLAAALTRLTGSDKSVETIARECGFISTSYLSQRMKEAYGTTPLRFRRAFLLQRKKDDGPQISPG